MIKHQELEFLRNGLIHMETAQPTGWINLLLKRIRLWKVKRRVRYLEKMFEKDPRIAIRKSQVHGNGVFSLRDIKCGELLEEAPYITVSNELMQYENISDYLFKIDESTCALIFGCGSIFNHSAEPNINCRLDKRKGIALYYARVDIPAGQELFISYGDAEWFAERSIEMK